MRWVPRFPAPIIENRFTTYYLLIENLQPQVYFLVRQPGIDAFFGFFFHPGDSRSPFQLEEKFDGVDDFGPFFFGKLPQLPVRRNQYHIFKVIESVQDFFDFLIGRRTVQGVADTKFRGHLLPVNSITRYSIENNDNISIPVLLESPDKMDKFRPGLGVLQGDIGTAPD
jgi:hypothetical protein